MKGMVIKMIKRNLEYPIDKKENMRGGEGIIKIEHLLTQSEMYDKGRLFAKVTVEQGDTVGFHVHEKEMEAFYIIGGKAEMSDNGETVMLSVGDTILTKSGEGHSVKSIGDAPLEMIALILFE